MIIERLEGNELYQCQGKLPDFILEDTGLRGRYVLAALKEDKDDAIFNLKEGGELPDLLGLFVFRIDFRLESAHPYGTILWVDVDDRLVGQGIGYKMLESFVGYMRDIDAEEIFFYLFDDVWLPDLKTYLADYNMTLKQGDFAPSILRPSVVRSVLELPAPKLGDYKLIRFTDVDPFTVEKGIKELLNRYPKGYRKLYLKDRESSEPKYAPDISAGILYDGRLVAAWGMKRYPSESMELLPVMLDEKVPGTAVLAMFRKILSIYKDLYGEDMDDKMLTQNYIYMPELTEQMDKLFSYFSKESSYYVSHGYATFGYDAMFSSEALFKDKEEGLKDWE